MLLGFTTVRRHVPSHILEEKEEAMIDMEELFGDLPRLINPRTGLDDTDEIREMIVRSFPEREYCPDQRANRRKLYMAIYDLRTKSTRGWIRDWHVERGQYAQDVVAPRQGMLMMGHRAA